MAEPSAAVGERRGGTLEAGLDLLEVLADAPTGPGGGFGVTELARRVGADKGNVHRLLGVLQRRGYVTQDPLTRRWSVTVAVVALAGRVLRGLDLRTAATPVLVALVSETGETAHLAVATRSGGLYIAQERPTGRLSVETELGGAPLLHATATGKALLAWRSPDERARLISPPLVRPTPASLATRRVLEADLDGVRSRGFAIDDEEFQPGVRCVAAPVRDLRDEVVGTVGVSGPVERVSRQRMRTLGGAVVAAADQITAALGGAPG